VIIVPCAQRQVNLWYLMPGIQLMPCLIICCPMQSIDALCDALDEFEGGVVVISHDAQLLQRLCADEERSQVRQGAAAKDGRVCMLCWLLVTAVLCGL
jgi:hypothetical protein